MKQNCKTEKLVDKGIFVDLCKDPGFKAVFADINHKSLLIGLLNEILPQNAQIKDILHLPPFCVSSHNCHVSNWNFQSAGHAGTTCSIGSSTAGLMSRSRKPLRTCR